MALGFEPSPPSYAAPPGLLWKLLSSQPVALGSGQEWHSLPFTIAADTTTALRCDSEVRFYAGLFTEIEYAAARQRSRAFFPFQRGTDRITFEQAFTPGTPIPCRIVLRIGAFAPAGTIRVALWVARPEETVVHLASPPKEEKEAESRRLKRNRRIMAGILGGVFAIAAWLTWFDVTLFLRGNLGLFDSTLNAEGSAVFAIVAVVSGLYAAYRELIVKPAEPPKGP